MRGVATESPELLVACGAIGLALSMLVYLAASSRRRASGEIERRRSVSGRVGVAAVVLGLAANIALFLAIVGDLFQYAYTGPTLATRVRYVGVELADGGFRAARTCPEWRGALAAGRFGYVVLSPGFFSVDNREIDRDTGWTTTIPGTSVVFHHGTTTVYRLTSTPDPATCP